jgi:O-acetyl-ADP-ribose deacetylase (regulator of RNase III)
MNRITGDLLKLAEQGHFDIIVQGCNCFNTLGAGLALQIKNKYPAAHIADNKTVRGDLNKLGTYTMASVSNNKFSIVNAYTQYGMSSGEDVFEYTAFRLILEKLLRLYPTARYGFPLIGCGLAHGDEKDIVEMISDFSDEIEELGGTVTLVDFG